MAQLVRHLPASAGHRGGNPGSHRPTSSRAAQSLPRLPSLFPGARAQQECTPQLERTPRLSRLQKSLRSDKDLALAVTACK